MNRILKADKYNKRHNAVKINFGMNITRDHKEAIMFDAKNGKTNCKGAEILKINQIYNFYPFDYLGPATSTWILPCHTKIQVHLIYGYKKDGIYKACVVDYGNMTRPNIETY